MATQEDAALLATFRSATSTARWDVEVADVKDRVPPRLARVYASVHEDNVRSLNLCARFGLTEEMARSHPTYRRIITGHQD